MTNKLQFNTPQGRFVSGSLTEKRTTDRNNRPIDPEKQRFEFGLAIPKTDPALPELFGQITGFARAEYVHAPMVQQRIDTWMQTMSGFSMKISDGDKPKVDGSVNQHTVGHFVFWFSTAMNIQTCGPDNVQIDPASIKRGWYVDVSGNCAVNGLTDDGAGIYMNPGWVRLRAYGEEILGGMSADQAFGAPAGPALGAPPAGNVSGAPGGGMPGTGQAAPAANPTQQAAPPASTPMQQSAQPAPGGLPGMDAAPPASSTASPSNAHPPHPGILNTGLPGQ